MVLEFLVIAQSMLYTYELHGRYVDGEIMRDTIWGNRAALSSRLHNVLLRFFMGLEIHKCLNLII